MPVAMVKLAQQASSFAQVSGDGADQAAGLVVIACRIACPAR